MVLVIGSRCCRSGAVAGGAVGVDGPIFLLEPLELMDGAREK